MSNALVPCTLYGGESVFLIYRKLLAKVSNLHISRNTDSPKIGMNCYNGLREESSMKSFALLTMKSETSFRRNLQPTASDEIKSVKLPTKSDFITK